MTRSFTFELEADEFVEHVDLGHDAGPWSFIGSANVSVSVGLALFGVMLAMRGFTHRSLAWSGVPSL